MDYFTTANNYYQISMEKQSLIQSVGFFHPTRRFYRYTVLAVVSLICFGSYFAFDEIQPIANDLEKVSLFNYGLGNLI